MSRRGSPGPARDRPAAPSAGPKLLVKPEAIPKFDPAKEGSFKRYSIKLTIAARANKLDQALDIADPALKDFLAKDEADWDSDEETLAEQSSALFLYIAMSIEDTSDDGDKLLGLLHDKYYRSGQRSHDDGAGAYKELHRTYGGITRVSRVGLINGLKDIALKGNAPNDIQSYEAELSSAFTKLAKAGEEVSSATKISYLLSGLDGRQEWDALRIELTKQDLKEGSMLTYESALEQFKQLAPTVYDISKSRASGEVYVAVTPRGGGPPKGSEHRHADCWRCGGRWRPKGHSEEECEAKHKECKICHKKGHIVHGCPERGKAGGRDEDKDKEAKEGAHQDESLARVLKQFSSKLDSLGDRMSKMEDAMKEGSQHGGTAGLAITDHSGGHAYISEDDPIEYGGVIF
jgi:hypothetical protein